MGMATDTKAADLLYYFLSIKYRYDWDLKLHRNIE